MLTLFTIFNKGGIVLWEKSFNVSFCNIINNFIHDIFIKEQSIKTFYVKDDLVVKWTISNKYELVFAVVYSNFSQLDYVDELLENVKQLFCQLYSEKLEKKNFASKNFDFDSYFDLRIKKFDALNTKKSTSFVSTNDTILDKNLSSQDFESCKGIIINDTILKSDLKLDSSTQISLSPEETKFPLKKSLQKRNLNKNIKKNSGEISQLNNGESLKKNKKIMRKWIDDDILDNDYTQETLDYSVDSKKPLLSVQNDIVRLTKENWDFENTQNGFVIKEFDDDIESFDIKNDDIKENRPGVFDIFTNIIKKKALSLNDLTLVLTKMNEQLLKKNIAKEVADDLCESVKNSLIGKNIGTFQSIQGIVKTTMESSLKRILTPSAPIDLMKEITYYKTQNKPYIISFVGVNGVGKSTSLSKIAFWFLRNQLKVLIAACDTFRSGAIEQLQVHVKNLQQLSEKEGSGKIELFEKGYGRDANLVASNAILYAKKKEFDVVLIDTSGRRHNDPHLMSSLEKLVNTNNIDRVFQVAEALAGTDIIAQARNFNNALGLKKKIDGFIISKIDTVGNVVGTIVSITWATGVPILFIGNGQTYTDIRVLSVSWVITKNVIILQINIIQ
ncbi:hypothetical protein PCANB_003084 [Pneumocystis canis]|nr:hypothetical protein PCANB_003084 [Pneumocystis canis]